MAEILTITNEKSVLSLHEEPDNSTYRVEIEEEWCGDPDIPQNSAAINLTRDDAFALIKQLNELLKK